MEKRYIAKNGAIVWGLLAVSLIRDADGKPAYFISQIQDMSHAHEIQQELEYKALHDPLTGLANRRKFQLALTDALDVTRHTGTEHRPEERRVGKEWVSTCRSRWSLAQ